MSRKIQPRESRKRKVFGVRLAHPKIIALYMRDIDRTLIRENLKLTPGERLRKLEAMVGSAEALRGAGARAMASRAEWPQKA
jgi:hypothetical protein